ncbi:MAG TPA: AtpZ/AtpI family protein [bacterium]|nr:AtpZ/AtpI family protein [bacterium]HPN42655.1 AtpZ/AtpI family protein [bacterium]
MKKSTVQVLDIGIQFAVAVGLCMAGGYWLDKKLGTIPLFFILGVLLGASAGFLNIYRTVYSEKKENKKGLQK